MQQSTDLQFLNSRFQSKHNEIFQNDFAINSTSTTTSIICNNNNNNELPLNKILQLYKHSMQYNIKMLQNQQQQRILKQHLATQQHQQHFEQLQQYFNKHQQLNEQQQLQLQQYQRNILRLRFWAQMHNISTTNDNNNFLNNLLLNNNNGINSNNDLQLLRGMLQDEQQKPTHSYIGLIATAILQSKDKKLVLGDIYQWVLERYPYFRSRGSGWRNSVRHNLSLNDCFIKVGRCSSGKGHYWAVHPANVEDFLRGDFRRKKALKKARRAILNMTGKKFEGGERMKLRKSVRNSRDKLGGDCMENRDVNLNVKKRKFDVLSLLER